MDQRELQMLLDEFERLDQECNTPEKAQAQLQSEGLIDENGVLAPMYRSQEEHVH